MSAPMIWCLALADGDFSMAGCVVAHDERIGDNTITTVLVGKGNEGVGYAVVEFDVVV